MGLNESVRLKRQETAGDSLLFTLKKENTTVWRGQGGREWASAANS